MCVPTVAQIQSATPSDSGYDVRLKDGTYYSVPNDPQNPYYTLVQQFLNPAPPPKPPKPAPDPSPVTTPTAGSGGSATGGNDRSGYGGSGGGAPYGTGGTIGAPSSGPADYIHMDPIVAAGLGLVSTVAPFPYSLPATLANVATRGANTSNSDSINTSLGGEGLGFGQALGGVLGLNDYGSRDGNATVMNPDDAARLGLNAAVTEGGIYNDGIFGNGGLLGTGIGEGEAQTSYTPEEARLHLLAQQESWTPATGFVTGDDGSYTVNGLGQFDNGTGRDDTTFSGSGGADLGTGFGIGGGVLGPGSGDIGGVDIGGALGGPSTAPAPSPVPSTPDTPATTVGGSGSGGTPPAVSTDQPTVGGSKSGGTAAGTGTTSTGAPSASSAKSPLVDITRADGTVIGQYNPATGQATTSAAQAALDSGSASASGGFGGGNTSASGYGNSGNAAKADGTAAGGGNSTDSGSSYGAGGDKASGTTAERGFAQGGFIPGAPDGQVDNHPINADEGEFVLNRQSAQTLGPGLLGVLNDPAHAANVAGIFRHLSDRFGGGLPDWPQGGIRSPFGSGDRWQNRDRPGGWPDPNDRQGGAWGDQQRPYRGDRGHGRRPFQLPGQA